MPCPRGAEDEGDRMSETTARPERDATIRVCPVRGETMRREFLDLARRLYRDDPHWVPPLEDNIRELLGFRPHPFHDTADLEPFLAYRDGVPCGRIAAIVNHAHNLRHRDRRGFVGFFESENDPAVAAALFDRAREWLADRDVRRVRGPMNPSMNYETGLLIDGFDGMPVFMMTYNPPYYPKLWEDYGFRTAKNLLAFLGNGDTLPRAAARIAPLAEGVLRRMHATVRRIDRGRFKREVRMFLDLYNRSMDALWAFLPLSSAEVEHIARSLEHLVVPELGVVIEIDGKPVGCMLGMLDYNPRIREIDGKLWPFGFLKLLSNRDRIRRLRLLSINVAPEYQTHGLGVVLLHEMLRIAAERKIEACEFSWVLEDNHLAVRGLRNGGAHIYRRYRVYDYGPTED